MEPTTHLAIDESLSGSIRSMGPGHAVVALETTQTMAVDERGLVHGGFVFGLADYAAMLTINVPTVVLAAANVRFVAPVRVGETLVAESRAAGNGTVEVVVTRDDVTVMLGEFSCRVLDRHVLDR